MATSLGDRLDAGYAKAWKPKRVDKRLEKPSEKVEGVVADISLVSSEYGEPYVCLTIEQDDGVEVAFHAFHTVARAEIAKKQPQVGERVAVGYYGTGEPAKSGMSGPQLFRLVVDRDQKPFDYSRLTDDAGTAAADAWAAADAADTPTGGGGPVDGDIPFAPTVY
jgi:hypothetical protein